MLKTKASGPLKTFLSVLIFLVVSSPVFAYSSSVFSLKICDETKLDAPLHDNLLKLEKESSGKLNSAEFKEFKSLLATCGWPTYESAGVDGIDAAAKLLFRSSIDPKFQITVLRDLDPQVGVDIVPYQYAQLSDAIRLMDYGTQVYGTILSIDDRGIVRPLGTLKSVDARLFFRDFYGLPTLKEDMQSYKPTRVAGFDGSHWDGKLGRRPPAYAQPKLRNELGVMIAADQSTRVDAIRATGKQRSKLMANVRKVDKNNLGKIKKIFDEFGFPTIAMVGRDGVSTAFLLVQHADADPEFQKHALDLARPLMERRELSRRQYAYLIDRVRLSKGEKQLYGTQVSVKSGKATPLPVVDPKDLDVRRAEMFMGPENAYLRSIGTH